MFIKNCEMLVVMKKTYAQQSLDERTFYFDVEHHRIADGFLRIFSEKGVENFSVEGIERYHTLNTKIDLPVEMPR